MIIENTKLYNKAEISTALAMKSYFYLLFVLFWYLKFCIKKYRVTRQIFVASGIDNTVISARGVV